MNKEDLSEFCAPGVQCRDEMKVVSDRASLRMITFMPPYKTNNPPVVFVAGWISLIRGWKHVLQEMTKDFIVYYIETREKISSKVKGKAKYSVEAIGSDIVSLISMLGLRDNDYILFGSSLGGTVILDCCRLLGNKPLCLVLVGPNAVFRVPKLGMVIIYLFYPGCYMILKPIIKWYLKTFRLNIKADYAQYEKYCNALDAADPWKLKKAVIPFSKYQVWPLLDKIEIPALIIGASKDKLHEPENLKQIVARLKNATYLDLETNEGTHGPDVVIHMRKYIQRLLE